MALGDLTIVQTVQQSPGTTGPWVRGVACDPEWGIMFDLTTLLTLSSYKYDTDGNLTLPASDVVVCSGGDEGFGLAIDISRRFLFVCLLNSIRIYSYDIDGILTYKTSTIISTEFFGISLDTVNRIAATGRGTSGIVTMEYADDGSAFSIVLDVDDQGGQAFGSGWDVDRRFLFVANRLRGVEAYSCSDVGILTHINNISIGDRAVGPQGVAVDTVLKLVFVPFRSDGLAVFSYNETTGEITHIDTTAINDNSYGVALDTVNQIVFVGGSWTYSYSYDSLGALTLIDSAVRDTFDSYAIAIDTTKQLIFDVSSPISTISPAASAETRSIFYEVPPTIPILTKIESAMKRLIGAMRNADDYFYDWGEANIEDAAQVTAFPSPLVYLIDVDNLDDVDTGAHAQSYHQMATFRIIVRGEVTTEPAIPNFAINPEHNKALDDLLKLFGNNYSLDSECDVILFSRMERDIQRRGDVFKSSEMSTIWHVYYQQDRVNPLLMG